MNSPVPERKKLRLPGEATYVLGILIMSFAVAMVTATDFGVSMIVAPAYILSLYFPALTFGQSEYLIQGLLFLLFCLLMKKIRPVYLTAFLTCLLYGAALDLWRVLIPVLNPLITPPGSLPLLTRIIFFALGTLLTALSVALFFKTYLYPQVYDFFVKGIAQRFQLNRTRFKIGFDFACLSLSVLMTLLLFGRFHGIGPGTIITALINGVLIGFFDQLLDRWCVFPPLFPKLARHFSLNAEG